MPQLNVETFVTQYVWLLVILGVTIYHATTRLELAEIIKLRKKI